MKEYKIIDGQLAETETVTETKTIAYDLDFLQQQAKKLRTELARLDMLIAKAKALMIA